VKETWRIRFDTPQREAAWQVAINSRKGDERGNPNGPHGLRPVTALGRHYRSRYAFARACGISCGGLSHRIRQGWSFDRIAEHYGLKVEK